MHTTMTNNNNANETMTQTFSCEFGLKGLKDPKKCLNQESKKFLLKGLKSSF